MEPILPIGDVRWLERGMTSDSKGAQPVTRMRDPCSSSPLNLACSIAVEHPVEVESEEKSSEALELLQVMGWRVRENSILPILQHLLLLDQI